METTFPLWLEHCQQRMATFFKEQLFLGVWPSPFEEALNYPLLTGGKRIRPALVLGAYEAVSGNEPGMDVLYPAAALELIHTYSLVHDDLPCMDDDDERRGKPTVHKAYDEATAVLVGDALLTEAFSLLTRMPAKSDVRVDLIKVLSQSAGAFGMIGGQVADVDGVEAPPDETTLTRIHAHKTGALIRAAVVMGGIAAGADTATRNILESYGDAVGLAFQLADDLLDAQQDAEAGNVHTFVQLLGEEGCREKAHRLSEQAQQLVEGLPRSGQLQALAHFFVHRGL